MKKVNNKKDKDYELQRERGEKLYKFLLDEVHHGDTEAMHKNFELMSRNIDMYGITQEKCFINFCAFKYDVVISFYSSRVKERDTV